MALINISENEYRAIFNNDPHIYLSKKFIHTVKDNYNKIIYLVSDTDNKKIGLIADLSDSKLQSPCSAPFGGFHFKDEFINTDIINNFMFELIDYANSNNITEIEITFPPQIYSKKANSKFLNGLLNIGFNISTVEINNEINLKRFSETYKISSVTRALKKATSNRLIFSKVSTDEDIKNCYDIITDNRYRLNRPLRMSYEQVLKTYLKLPVDFFLLKHTNKNIAAAGVYHVTENIVQTVFLADIDDARSVRGMDFLFHSLWTHYKKLGFDYVDAGISTENGKPNSGLIRFKEIHECDSSPRFTVQWNANR